MRKVLGFWMAAILLAFGVAHAGGLSASDKAKLESEAQSALEKMSAKDPELKTQMHHAAAYIVFPSVKEGGLVVGGAGGHGVVYEKGQKTGYASLHQVSAGALAGGQKFAELILIQSPDTLAKFRAGNFDFGGKASAVAVKAGAASAAEFENGVKVFSMPEAGAMVSVSLTGQKIKLTD
jgi:lipid-binding SYLF domain-containing protein